MNAGLLLKKLLPSEAVNFGRRLRDRTSSRARPVEGVFAQVYRDGMWPGGNGPYSSGEGSHDSRTVEPYLEAVGRWLKSVHAENMTLVDLGCGDFNVGSRLAAYCKRYVGVDVVRELVDYNQATFGSETVSFAHLNMIDDALPTGDIGVLRQVLQHLSNDQILAILPKLTKFRWVVVTEIQATPIRVSRHNADKPHNGDTRVYLRSGVFLDRPPFSIPADQIRLLSQFETDAGASGVLSTYLIEFAA